MARNQGKEKPAASKRQHAGTSKSASTREAAERAAAASVMRSILNRRGTELERPGDKDVLHGADVILRWDESDGKKPLESMTDAEVKAEIDSIEERIKELGGKIQAGERMVCGILHDSVRYAKQIGELLCRARDLLPHGQYQEWVKENFHGSPATARAYKRIADFENWQKIQARLTGDPSKGMSIRQALALIEEKTSEPTLKYDHDTFLGQIERYVAEWPGHACKAYAADSVLMERLCKIISLVCDEYRRQTEEERKRKQKEDAEGLRAFAEAKLKLEQDRRAWEEKQKKKREELDAEFDGIEIEPWEVERERQIRTLLKLDKAKKKKAAA